MSKYTSDPTKNSSHVPDPDQVLYKDKTDAKRAATARGCSGTHSHEVDGKTHHMPCATHEVYHDTSGDNVTSDTGSGSYAGSAFDLTTPFGGSDSDTSASNFLRPRSGAPSVEFGRDRDTGEFDAAGGDPVPLERDQDTGQVGPDPFAIGNFGEFNSPYDTTDEEEDKYG